MCCCITTRVPVGAMEVIQETLAIGQFVKEDYWLERYVGEEDRIVRAYVSDANTITLRLYPVITANDPEHPRIAGSIMMEISAKIAEKLGGVITQSGIIVPCGSNQSPVVLAHYPEERLDYGKLCPGFKASMLGEGYGE